MINTKCLQRYIIFLTTLSASKVSNIIILTNKALFIIDPKQQIEQIKIPFKDKESKKVRVKRKARVKRKVMINIL